MTPGHALITFSPLEVLAARESTVPPSLALTLTARPFFAQTTANTARFGRGIVQALTVPGWAREKTQVRSLWVSALLGRPAWRSQSKVLGGVPALVVRGRPVPSSEATWVAPGWAVVTYDVPASMVFHPRAVETRIAKKPPQWRCDRVEWESSCPVGACLPAFGYSHRDHRRHTLAWSGHAAKSDAILVVSAHGSRRLFMGSCAEATFQRQYHPGGHRWTACRHYRRRFCMAKPGCARSHDSWAAAFGTWHHRRRCAARRCVGARPVGGGNIHAARPVPRASREADTALGADLTQDSLREEAAE